MTLDLLASLDEPGTHPYKQQLLAICRRVFVKFDERPHWQRLQLFNDVDEVIKGGPAPCLSHKERVAILEAWKA